MIRLIVFLLILFAAFLFGHTLFDIEGRVILALPSAMHEVSLFVAIVFTVFGLIALAIIYWLSVKIIRGFVGSRQWLGAYSRKQQHNAYYQAINDILINENVTALQNIRKTIGGDFQGSNYLMAAELEIQNNNNKQAIAYLIQAMDSPKTQATAKLKHARLLLQDNQSTQAMEVLSGIEGKTRKTKAFVILKLEILEALNDWPQIDQLAKENKKILGEDYVSWASQCTRGEFAAIASKQGANALKQHWLGLSRAAKKDQANQHAYIQLLIDQELYADAETELSNLYAKHESELLLPLFKQLVLPTPGLAIKTIESSIKRKPENAELYSVLAHIAYNSGDIELAKKALSKALELKPTSQDKALLAKLLESSEDYKGANEVYQGLL